MRKRTRARLRIDNIFPHATIIIIIIIFQRFACSRLQPTARAGGGTSCMVNRLE